MKTLSESLLSDFDTLEKKSESDMYLQLSYQKWESGSKSGYDSLGRPLEVGDLVICIEAYSPVPAKIVDIKNKKIAISLLGDNSDNRNSQNEIKYDYKSSDECLKISPEVLKAIYLTK